MDGAAGVEYKRATMKGRLWLVGKVMLAMCTVIFVYFFIFSCCKRNFFIKSQVTSHQDVRDYR